MFHNRAPGIGYLIPCGLLRALTVPGYLERAIFDKLIKQCKATGLTRDEVGIEHDALIQFHVS